MSDMREVTLVLWHQTEKEVDIEVDYDEVREWAVMDLPAGSPIPQVTPTLVKMFLEAHRHWDRQMVEHLDQAVTVGPVDLELHEVLTAD